MTMTIATIVTHRILGLVEHDHIGLSSTSAAASPHAAGLQQKICFFSLDVEQVGFNEIVPPLRQRGK